MPRDASLCSYNSIRSLGGFVLEVSLSYVSTSIQSKALLDSGASTCSIDIAYIHTHNILVIHTSQPIPIESINGTVLSSGAVTKVTTPLVLRVGSHQEVLTFYLIASPQHPIFLGLSWFETHNPIVDWCNHSIIFPQEATSLDSMGTNSSLVTHSPNSMGTDLNFVTHLLHSVGTNSNVESCSPDSIWAISNLVRTYTSHVVAGLPFLQTLCLPGIMIFLMCSKRKLQIGCQNLPLRLPNQSTRGCTSTFQSHLWTCQTRTRGT
jgi:hypothetical protein